MREDLDIPMPSMGPSYRVSRKRPGMDPNSRNLALIAGGIGGLLLALVGVWSVAGGHQGGVPVIAADARPLKVKPADPGGLRVAGEHESIMGPAGAGGGRASLAPAPEVPALQALKAQERPAMNRPPAHTVSLSTAPVATAPVVAPPAARLDPPKPMSPRPELARAPAAKPAPHVLAPHVLAPHVLAPHVLASHVLAVPAGRGPQVQLAALGTEQAAMVEWARLSRKDPALFGGRRPSVMRVTHGGHVFWRLRTAGFATTAQATGFCVRLKAAHAACEVARF